MSHRKSNGKQDKRIKRQDRNRWPVWLALTGLVLVGLALFAFSRGSSKPKAAIEVAGSPALKVDKEKVDLGEVKLGQTVQVSFQLTNVGDQSLRFSKEPYIEVVEGC